MCVGQTCRLLKTRVDEHKAAVKYGKSDVSAAAEHVWEEEHDVNFQSVSVLAWEPVVTMHMHKSHKLFSCNHHRLSI